MKIIIRTLLLLLVLPSLFYACGRKSHPQSLILADSLASANPDSAITLLKSIDSSMQAEPEAVSDVLSATLAYKANDRHIYSIHRTA